MKHFETAVTSSHELAKIPLLGSVLNVENLKPYISISGRLACRNPRKTLTVGWGRKPNTELLRRVASRRGLPWITLEDGFFCYASHPARGALRYAVITDSVGIYYDATQPSQLEAILQSEAVDHADILRRAARAIEFIVTHGISKYGFSDATAALPPKWSQEGVSKKRVLVIDQVENDCSVTYGWATADTFRTMLDAARHEHPDAEIVVKLHPDTALGKKRGYLSSLSLEGCTVIGGNVSPVRLFPYIERVYTVTSQVGFEALLHNKKVECFGLPFYSGWGLTSDRQSTPRRTKKLSVEALFAGACLLYTKYMLPEKQKTACLEEVLEHLHTQRNLRALPEYRRVYCVGFSLWKRTFMSDFLRGVAADVRFLNSSKAALLDTLSPTDDAVLLWGKRHDALAHEARVRGLQVLRAEDGFVRSVGLGSDFCRPSSLVLDARGIYYDPTQPSDLECILERGGFTESLLSEARELRRSLVEMNISKYNLSAGPLPEFLASGVRSADARGEANEVILVPGQVDDDASVKWGCSNAKVNSNRVLLETVRRENPRAFIIYKEHPDVATGNRSGKISRAEAQQLCDLHITQACDVKHLFERVDAVHTMTSLTGFEALLREKKVVTYGMPFYAGWGLTMDHERCARRTRQLTLDELVCGALLLYPRYFDWNAGHSVAAQGVLNALSHKTCSSAPSWGVPIPELVRRRMRQASFILEAVRGSLL